MPITVIKDTASSVEYVLLMANFKKIIIEFRLTLLNPRIVVFLDQIELNYWQFVKDFFDWKSIKLQSVFRIISKYEMKRELISCRQWFVFDESLKLLPNTNCKLMMMKNVWKDIFSKRIFPSQKARRIQVH